MIKKELKRTKIRMSKEQLKDLDDTIVKGLDYLPEYVNRFVVNNMKEVIQKKCCNAEDVDRVVKTVVNKIAMKNYDFTAEFIKDPIKAIKNVDEN